MLVAVEHQSLLSSVALRPKRRRRRNSEASVASVALVACRVRDGAGSAGRRVLDLLSEPTVDEEPSGVGDATDVVPAEQVTLGGVVEALRRSGAELGEQSIRGRVSGRRRAVEQVPRGRVAVAPQFPRRGEVRYL